ncbi:TPA: cysteine--tRNA ligase [Candidatus Poribacteria bacterium]|nr:cysteine--tRNA ligase [Candidatus Poribacteria bacterium]
MKIYNTMTRHKEDFVPLQEGKVTMYSCGPTVYNYFHLGNARAFLVPDMVRRYLEYKGYEVKLIINITDIEDKIINKANELGVSSEVVAKEYTEAYLEDSKNLGIRPATVQPKATEHIPEIIALVQTLLDKGVAYEVDGDVYYSVKKFNGYGKLSGRDLDDMHAVARVEVDERKDDPADFALWKRSKLGEPAWDSPWGKGRPGWHIECSAMAMKYLGETIDIHAGGADLIFPHHENEIAQSEVATGKPFANYWFHWAFLQVGGRRMGKSEQNFLFVRDALKKYRPEAIRHFLLSAHYRHPLDYTEENIVQASNASKRIHNCINTLRRLSTSEEVELEKLSEEGKQLYESVGVMREQFEAAMDDDFNTAGAIGAIFELVGQANAFVSENEGKFSEQSKALLGYVHENLVELCDVLGIYSADSGLERQDTELVNSLMDLLLEIRQDARAKKDWSTADKIRDKLKEFNIILKDTREGVVWEFGAS